jgi:hypothetical protein
MSTDLFRKPSSSLFCLDFFCRAWLKRKSKTANSHKKPDATKRTA